MRILNIILLFISFNVYTQASVKSSTNITTNSDTSTVIALNNQAFNARLTNPGLTISNGNKALKLAVKLEYTNGIAESYRVIGIGKSYKNSIDGAIENYLNSLTYFKKAGNLQGEAKVFNNIGNLYRDIDSYKSLENFNKSLKIAKKLNIKDLQAGLYLNIGTANQKLKHYSKALSYYKLSLSMFNSLGNKVGVIQSHQNLGVLYLNLRDYESAKKNLEEGLAKAKEEKLINSAAAINLTLSSIHIAQKQFDEAESTIKEGLMFTRILKDEKLEYNYILTSYELENKRKNYFKALQYLQQAYKQDSARYANNISDKISLLETQHMQLEKQKESELIIAKQKYSQILFLASSIVALLAFFVIFLLVKNVKKSAQTNKELTRLNQEVSKQKDDLDRTNQNLEELIEIRTMDLKNKNKKLSEYSSHLSHQIRSPVATLKGLMLLENDNLIDKEEFVEQMGKCINDLDDKIININENLNNPNRSSLINED
ncbi:tetratricopeptide repeat protein [Daejeonella lutea]|uniref:Tetratricopeptide repeat-containing protein n=1 Tax=Daejeonella lutea TaxID=572036 RepID=A0A1T5F6M8_9SPHI|nr:tetratricopeptide repeat protein [Daejeonella lutea]SKB91770.1 Tetratricopeptide repeat-containing protein [Daejeonella lutea]